MFVNFLRILLCIILILIFVSFLQTKSEDDVKSEKAWLESDKVWLIHKGGFSSATLLKTNGMSPLPEGKVKVKVDHGGEIIEVEEEDIEKVNKTQVSIVWFSNFLYSIDWKMAKHQSNEVTS